MESKFDINLFTSNFKDKSHDIYKKLRTEDPVHRLVLPNNQIAWLITRYDDALNIFSDKRLFKNPYSLEDTKKTRSFIPVQEMDVLINHMLNVDPPNHSKLRRLVQQAFTPKTIETLRNDVQVITNDLLEKINDKQNIDLIDKFAFPLPIIVICKILGIPKEDHKIFRKWSNILIEATNLPDKMNNALPEIRLFIDYLDKLIKNRREHPTNDLVTKLIQAEVEGEHLSKKELFSMIFLLIIAGHETTVNLIGNGILALLEHPQELEKLKENPELIKPAVEEILRFYSPVELTTNRWASEKIIINNKVISKGDMIVVSIASVNRDENIFDNPEELNISRENNPHLAFGRGIHFCLGAPLARLEGQIALSTFFQRISNVELNLKSNTPIWRPSYLMRGLQELPVRIS